MTLNPAGSDPLYRQLADALKALIQNETLRPGDKIGTQQALADEYNVSVITVKRALSELADEGLIYSRVGRGTFVADEVPEKPQPQMDHHVLGMVLRDLKSPFFSLIAQAVEQHAYESGYSIMLSAAGGQMTKEVRQIEHFQEVGVDGLIVASMQPDHSVAPTIRELHASGFPYVMVSYVADDDIYFVGTDHEKGAHWATSHLIDQGYAKIGYLAAEQNNRLSAVRERGYRQAMEEHGLAVNDQWIYRMTDEGEWNHYTAGYRIGQQVVNAWERPEAVFAYNDLLALGFMQAALDGDLRVPEDVALIGFDDIARSKYASVPLTTIRQRTSEIGRRVVEVLLKRVNGDEVARRTQLMPELVRRKSCGGAGTAQSRGAS